MLVIFVFGFLVSLTVDKVSGVKEDYYWRDYDGTIPDDAVVGGQSFGHDIFIGQAYIRDEGVFPVTINPGVIEVAVPIKGVKRTDKYVKILCGPPANFEWVPANVTNLHVVLLNKHAVFGGHEDSKGYVYIGKSTTKGGTQIGKINAFALGNAKFFYASKDSENNLSVYDVLCYPDFGQKLDIRETLIPEMTPKDQQNI
ncbi:hypothetical protein Zmor_019841 [Zophobas morio]|uniref:Uncharacterized protein n=1 Tax=Zophobas morio TaxID=2755281 RepID=A0AA38I2V6_9CUCU|nr:hypothetical protein Zmor_019841 [Zophobas morio]